MRSTAPSDATETAPEATGEDSPLIARAGWTLGRLVFSRRHVSP